ncbi:MAG: alpha-hydroxy acid oxidase [Gemmatimonadaceae bacterium]
MINLHDFEQAAASTLDLAAWGYYAGGANDEITLRENRAAWDRLAIRYRTMIDVSVRDTSTTVLGIPISFPVLIAPTAMQKLAHPDGELATVRAAGKAGTIMCVSTTATTSLEDVRAAATGPTWFQLYVYKDRAATKTLLESAKRVGYSAIVVTVDTPLLGRRERDVRNGFSLPPHLQIANAIAAGRPHLNMPGADGVDSGLAKHLHELHDASLTHRDIAWIAETAGLPVLVKGIVRGDDALRAVEHGAAGVVVSNHGGRQLDTAIASARALPEIVDAIGGRGEVLVDGGIRRGTDVLKAVALGASAVLIGRPVLWGLAAGGEAGVSDILALMRGEFELAMALSGCPTVRDITRDLVLAG